MSLKNFRVRGGCLVAAHVETLVSAETRHDADRIARARFKENIKKMLVDPEITSAYDFEVHYIEEETK